MPTRSRLVSFDVLWGGVELKKASSRLCGGVFVLIASILLLCSSCHKRGDYICGVPVTGSPWSLAAAIYEAGDGSFVPESVEILPEKAYIHGWYYQPDSILSDTSGGDGFLKAVIICDISSTNQVTHACLSCAQLDKED